MRKLIPLALPITALLACTALSYAAAPRNLGRAIEAQRALVAERPGDSTVENDLGSLLLLADDVEGAEQAYRRATELDSGNAAAHFNLGLLLQKRDDRRAALKEFRRTIELEPRNAWAHYQTGTIYDHWGLDSAARKAYAKALAIDPALGNPEVNPHLIDNELATSAMLYSYQHYREELQPEKRFEEPARIAGVLIDRPRTDQDTTATREVEGETGGGFVRSNGAPAETHPEMKVEPSDGDTGANGAGAPADTESRVLSSKDLDPARATNQVGGGAAASKLGAAGSNPGGRITSGTRARTRDNSTTPTRPTLRGPQNPGTTPPPPTTFLPTSDSTGRMETRLVEIDELS